MKLCNDVITVFNARVDQDAGGNVWVGTVINGASWFMTDASTVDASKGGLVAANKATIRIPEGADACGKAYADPISYRNAESVAGLWTLQQGDVIVKGEVPLVQNAGDAGDQEIAPTGDAGDAGDAGDQEIAPTGDAGDAGDAGNAGAASSAPTGNAGDQEIAPTGDAGDAEIAWTPAKLKKAYADCVTVLGVTDNRRAPNGKHWRVTAT